MNSLFKPLKSWKMEEDAYGRRPELCEDDRGRCWVVWIAWEGDGECLHGAILSPVSELADMEWSKPFRLSDVRPRITGLALAPWKDGVLLSWCDGGNPETDGVKVRAVRSVEDMDAPTLILPERRLPSGLVMAADGDRFFLAWTVREPGSRQVEGVIATDPTDVPAPFRISDGRRLNLQPAVEFSHGKAWVAWQSMSRNGSRIYARSVTDDFRPEASIEISRSEGGIDALCTLKAARVEGLWVAWQSDLDPVAGPGLVRWIDIAHVNASGRVHRPAEEMRDMDRNGSGEDQGFESPCLELGDDDRLIILGRGSQSIRRQDLTPGGWTERGQIDSEGWKCRGRVRTCTTGAGILVAYREKSGISIHLLRKRAMEDGPRGISESIKNRLDYSWATRNQVTVKGRRVLFGDIHQHTALSDGTGTAAETYTRARYRYKDDLVAVSEHESFLGKKTPPGEWAQQQALADDFYEPGEFVTLHAYEWTGAMHPGPGHKVVYPSSLSDAVFSRDDEATKTSAGLMGACRKSGSIVIPHHVGWTGADMENHDPEVQTCFEIVSCHGAYERKGVGNIATRGDDKDGEFVGDALDKGLRFGLVGGTDGHGLNWHHGVCRMKDSHRAGLTAVFTDEVTRQGVLDAMARRHCYATSGAKIGLWFEVDGVMMGEEVRPGGVSAYRVIVNGTSAISSLHLVSNGGVETPLAFDGRTADVQGTLPPPADGGWAYYYVRVVQDDGHVAWSSPIWVDASFDPLDDRMTA